MKKKNYIYIYILNKNPMRTQPSRLSSDQKKKQCFFLRFSMGIRTLSSLRH